MIYIRYLEDIESATKMMEVQITDSNSGLLSLLRGMERVYIEIEDTIGNQIEEFLLYMIYKIEYQKEQQVRQLYYYALQIL